MFKRKAPVAIGLGLVAAFAAGIALLQPQPRDADLLSPAHRTIRERYERLGHALPPETIRTTLLSRAETEGFVRVELPTLARVHLLRLTCTDAWKVDADLADHFNAYLTDKTTRVLDELPNRIAQGLADRMKNAADVRDFRPEMEVAWLDQPVGYLRCHYREGTTECLYQETYRLQDGRWTRDGQGQYFVSPRPR